MTNSVFHADFHDASRLNAATASRQTWLFLLCFINPQTIFYHQTFSSLMCVFLPLTKRNLSRLGNFLIVKYVIEIHVF